MSQIITSFFNQSNFSSYDPGLEITPGVEPPVSHSISLTKSQIENLIYKEIYKHSISSQPARLMQEIGLGCDWRTGVFLDSQEYLAKRLSCSIRTIKRHIALLCTKGILVKTRRGYKKTNHMVLSVIERELINRGAKMASDLNLNNLLDRDLNNLGAQDEYFNYQKEEGKKKKGTHPNAKKDSIMSEPISNIHTKNLSAQEFSLKVNEITQERLKAKGIVDPRVDNVHRTLEESLSAAAEYERLYQIELWKAREQLVQSLRPEGHSSDTAKPAKPNNYPPRRSWDYD